MPEPLNIQSSSYPVDYQNLWDSMVINNPAQVQALADKIYKNKSRYQSVSQETNVPWHVIACIHYRECDCNFNQHLYNGDSLQARTVHVPKGQPSIGNPPFTWEFSAIQALKYDSLDKQDWTTLPNTLYQCELYNGRGYLNKGVLSPYIWSGTNHYTKGKYASDGFYDANLVDKQTGIAPLMFCLLMEDENNM